MKKKGKKPEQVPELTSDDIFNAFSPLPPEMIEEFNQDWEYDRTRDDFEIDRKQYKIEIEWSQYDELQIQKLIALLFQYSRYEVENWHKADRSHEDGADLIIRDGDGDMAIQVKIKPKTNDRPQLLDLVKRAEKKKIYVYINTPSKKFLDSMNDFKEQVEFWNGRKLNDFFIKTNIGFTSSLVFDSHNLSVTIYKVRLLLFGIYKKCLSLKRVKTKLMNETSRDIIWRLKDNAVSFHKSNQCIIHICEQPVNMKNKRLNEHFVKIFLKYLDELNVELKSYLHYFSIFYEKNPDLVHNSIISNTGGSHWQWLTHYRTDNNVDNLLRELKNDKIMGHQLEEFNKKFPDVDRDNYWKEKAKNNDVWAEMEHRIRNLMIFGSGIEAVIDDIAREYGIIFRPTL